MSIDAYTNQVKKLQNIRKHLGNLANDIKLPQIIVVGDQSTGKSAILTALTGIVFPINSGMCTKCPIVIHCNYHNNKNGFFEKKEDGKLMRINIANKMQEHNEFNGIVNEPITIYCYGSEQKDCTIVDLPGMIHDGTDNDSKIRNMLKSYIKNPNSYILACIKSSQDIETAGVFQFINETENARDRTLTIYTKCDVNDGDNIEKLRNINNENKEKYHMVIALNPEIKNDENAEQNRYDKNFERKKFEEYKITMNENIGIQNLKNKLPVIYENIIRLNFPHLEAAMNSKIREFEKNLEIIGDKPLTSKDIINIIIKKLELDKLHNDIFKNYISLDEYNNIFKKIKIEEKKRIENDDDEDGFENSDLEALHIRNIMNEDGKIKNINSKLYDYKNIDIKDITFNYNENITFQGRESYIEQLQNICNNWNKNIQKMLDEIEKKFISNTNIELKCVDEQLNNNIKRYIIKNIKENFKNCKETIEIQLLNEYSIDSLNNPHYEVSKSEHIKMLEKIKNMLSNSNDHFRDIVNKCKQYINEYIDGEYKKTSKEKLQDKIKKEVILYFDIKIKDINESLASKIKSIKIKTLDFIKIMNDVIPLRERTSLINLRRKYIEEIKKLKDSIAELY